VADDLQEGAYAKAHSVQKASGRCEMVMTTAVHWGKPDQRGSWVLSVS
jgi:hypothetical protein